MRHRGRGFSLDIVWETGRCRIETRSKIACEILVFLRRAAVSVRVVAVCCGCGGKRRNGGVVDNVVVIVIVVVDNNV